MRAALVLVFLLLPITAGAQSSNSSVNCSNGVCTRVESFRLEDGRRWTRTERWLEDGPRRRERGWDRHGWPAHGWAPHGWTPRGWQEDRPRRHSRRDRDDDDD